MYFVISVMFFWICSLRICVSYFFGEYPCEDFVDVSDMINICVKTNASEPLVLVGFQLSIKKQ
jgi:hypothetical protein